MKPGTPLRVCHIVSGDGWGGLEAVVLSLVSAQKTSPDFAVSCLVLNAGRLEREARALGVPVRLIAESKASAWGVYRQLEQALRELRPDILHSHRYKENFFAYLLGPRLGLRNVVTLHGFEPPTALGPRIKVAIRDFVSFRLARRAHTRFAIVSRDLQLQYKVPDQDCTIIPNGVRMRALPVSAANGNTRDASTPVIGWAGRMVPIKSLSTLLEAVKLLSDLPRKPKVLLLGDGPERAALSEHAQRLGIAEQVEFAGFVDDPAPHYARMSLFALPSLHEGVPLALLEAMGAGIPALAAGVGGIPELIGDSGGAHLVPSHAPADWAQAIRRFTVDADAAREMARRGRALVASQYSLEAMLARYAEVYRLALSH